ncbi:hypothetical protein PTKIN_Ptkin16aG0095300 [Pterospermum kingtungense]
MDSMNDINTALNEINNDDEVDEAVPGEIYSHEADYEDEEYSIAQTRRNYRVLNEAEIRRLMEDSIAEASTVLSIPKDKASVLLRYFRWSVNEATDAWFSDDSKVSNKIGLMMLEEQEIQIPDELTCGICFESYSYDGLIWDKCGHPFCNDCWANYISNYISEGDGPLMIRCPEPSCRVALSQQLFDKIATEEQKKRFTWLSLVSWEKNLARSISIVVIVARQRAVKDLEKLKSQQIMKLGDIQGQVASELEFLVEAWKQIIECRQILRWTYAYRYFLPDNELGKIKLFEFLQGQAESGAERLHYYAERGVETFLIADAPSQKFVKFRNKLIALTRVTRNYFENLVNAMENGLSDVESKPIAV